MKKSIISISIAFVLLFSGIGISEDLSFDETEKNDVFNENTSFETEEQSDEISYHPLMQIDEKTIQIWNQEYQQAKKADIDQNLKKTIETTEDYSILDLLKYDAKERNQGLCSNCWAWPATSVVAIALNVQEGIYDRLSVQYINSCGEIVGYDCCDGGTLNLFARFYRTTDMIIPWSNENAEWKDRFNQCNTPCESIETEPNYPISAIYPETIETHEIPKEQVIENIKNILHQEKGVYFSWYLPDMDYRDDFSTFWDRQSEQVVYDLDWDCGTEFDEQSGGGHAVLCVGYHDEEGTENDYWIMLNSWGTSSQRPNGLFRINMHMDYDCTILFNGYEYYSFDFQTLDIAFGTEDEAPDPPSIDGPSSGTPEVSNTYNFSTIDYQGDDVYIMIDWGDDEITDWLGPFASEVTIQRNHTWEEKDTFNLRARAKDERGKTSLWSTLEVAMPKNKAVHGLFLDFLMYHFKLFSFLQITPGP